MNTKMQIVTIKIDDENTREVLVIKTNAGIVVSDNECIHYLNPEVITLPVTHEIKRDGKNYLQFGDVEINIEDLPDYAADDISAHDLPRWIRYFGIKSRIEYNYNLLQTSCNRINADIKFPAW